LVNNTSEQRILKKRRFLKLLLMIDLKKAKINEFQDHPQKKIDALH